MLACAFRRMFAVTLGLGLAVFGFGCAETTAQPDTSGAPEQSVAEPSDAVPELEEPDLGVEAGSGLGVESGSGLGEDL